MFAIVQNKDVIKYVHPGTSWTHDGVQYPPQWIAQASQAQKDQLGLVDVIHGAQDDQRFYWVSQNAATYDSKANVVNITFTSTAKNLNELKAQQVKEINHTAYTILLPSDWMVTKAYETQTAMPEEWKTWRQSVRDLAGTSCTAINACTTVAELAALSQPEWPKDPVAVADEQP